jgi:hypothetical protein
VVSTPVSYSGGTGLKCRPGDPLSYELSVVFLVTPGKYQDVSSNSATTVSFHVLYDSLLISHPVELLQPRYVKCKDRVDFPSVVSSRSG